MRTPGQDRELAVGFLFGEGIVRSIREDRDGLFLRRALRRAGMAEPRAGGAETRHGIRPETGWKRNFYVSSSCGVCGKTSLEALLTSGFKPVADAGWKVGEHLVQTLPERLRKAQPVFDQTGGLHAAGLFGLEGRGAGGARGRGAAQRGRQGDRARGCSRAHDRNPAQILLVSGRASFEPGAEDDRGRHPDVGGGGRAVEPGGAARAGISASRWSVSPSRAGSISTPGSQRVEIGSETFVSQADDHTGGALIVALN